MKHAFKASGVGVKEGRKERKGVLFKEVSLAQMYSAHMGEDGPLGTDSRQWAGII